MNSILEILLSWQFVLLACIVFVFAYMMAFIIRKSRIFRGVYELITSPSGVFAILCLVALSVLSWHLGVAWVTAAAAAWAAFFGIVPAALGYFEHREQVITMTNQYSASPLVAPPPPVIDPPPVVIMPDQNTNLPSRGTL